MTNYITTQRENLQKNLPDEIIFCHNWVPATGKKTAYPAGLFRYDRAGVRWSLDGVMNISRGVNHDETHWQENNPMPDEWEPWSGKVEFVLYGTDFAVIDFDHVFDNSGQWVSDKARYVYEYILSKTGATYREYSQSKRGLHILLKATPNCKAGGTVSGLKSINGVKIDGFGIELFYHAKKKICLTGDLYECEPRATIASGLAVDDLLTELSPPKKTIEIKPRVTPTFSNSSFDDAQRRAMLDVIPPSDLDAQEWLIVSTAAKNSGITYDFWDNWCKRDPARYKERENRQRWDSFAQNSADVGALANMAKRYNFDFKGFYRDWYVKYGGDEVMEQKTAATTNAKGEVAKIEEYKKKKRKAIEKKRNADSDIIPNVDWPDQEIDPRTNQFRPLKVSWNNVDYLLNRLGVTAKYNLLTNKIDFFGQNWETLTLDAVIARLRTISHKNGLKISKDDLLANVGVVAEANQYSPVCDYLDTLKGKWDGQDHIGKLFTCFELDPAREQDPEFLKLLVRRWFISCVVMAYNHTKCFDGKYQAAQGMLVLAGPQGRKKSRFLTKILPNDEWGEGGSVIDPADRDSKMNNLRYWIAELGEFGATLRRDKVEILKAFITNRTDTYRRPYAMDSRQEPRHTVFYGSINDTRFLKDITGDRRYWVIGILRVNEEILNTINLDQLWAQAVHYAFTERTKENEPIYRHWLTEEEIDQLEIQNTQYKKISVEQQLLQDKLNWDAPTTEWQQYTITQLCEVLGLSNSSIRMAGICIKKMAETDSRIGLPKNHKNYKFILPPIN